MNATTMLRIRRQLQMGMRGHLPGVDYDPLHYTYTAIIEQVVLTNWWAQFVRSDALQDRPI